MTDQRARWDAGRVELIRRRLAAAGMSSTEAAVPVGSPDLLSFGQQRLWFLDQLAPGTSAYHVPAAVRIRGPVEPGILQTALTRVVTRHAVLRARFTSHDGRPRQQIDPPAPVPLPVVEPSHPGADPLSEARAAARALAEQPFDLATGPLLRAALYRLADDDHVLAIVLHHIVCDGASAAILVREVCSTCLDLAAGRTAEPPSLPAQYWSFAQLQADQEAAGTWAAQLRFWRDTVGGLTAPLPLPEDDHAGAADPGAGRAERLSRRLDAALADAVPQVAARYDATVFQVLLAAWHAQLARRTGVTQVPVATPVTTRSRTEFEPIIGFFVNTLVMLGDAGGDPTFAELLARTRTHAMAALRHQDVPFEVLVRELNPPRRLGHEPLAQVLFSYQPDPPFPAQSGAVAFEVLPTGAPRAKYSLTLYVSADEHGLLATLEYDASRWRFATIASWLAAYEGLLLAVCRDPTLPISALDQPDQPVLTGPPAPEPIPVIAAFADWVMLTPNAVAVVDDAGPVGYAGLAAGAAGLAAELKAAGAGPEHPVLVAVPRGRATVVAMLAALLARAPFVPVDLNQPARRVAALVRQARAEVAVVAGDAASRADAVLPLGVTRIDLDRAPDGDPEAFCADALGRPGAAADLAYLMFTSGSTGVPKGVAVRRQALDAVVAAFAALLDAGPRDVTLGLTTTTFDISVLELLLPLTTGGTLRIVGDAIRTDPVAITAVLARDNVTIAQATPTTWRALLAGGWRPSRPMRLLCGGEALDAGLAAQLLRARDCRVWNVYGPTETTIWSAAQSLDATTESTTAPPIGEPLAGQRLMVLGPDGAPAPLGTPGELAIGGHGLARGYWGDPRSTAARFVPDPFAPVPGARLYRTGDVIRRHADGALEFLGRRDDQVKIRGHRVEPGEVAAELSRLPGVGECAVVAAQGGLVAFVTRRPDPPGERNDNDDAWAARMRDLLAPLLPSHLLPARIGVLDRLPVTPAGKLDVRALRESAEDLQPGRVPAAGLEATIAAVWTELLGRSPFADEDFFAAGGHSLLATQLARRIAEVAGAPVRVRHVFEHPTVAGLAELVDRVATAPALPQVSGLSAAQQRLVFLQRLEPESTAYHVTLAARFDAALDPDRLRQALAALVAAHPALRTAVLDAEGVPGRIVVDQAVLPLRVVDTPAGVALDAATVSDIAEPELREAFDLQVAPLARGVLVRGVGGDSALVLVAHHVVLDGWSAHLLVEQLHRAYQGERIAPTADLAAMATEPPSEAALDRAAARIAGWPRTLALPVHSTGLPAGVAGRVLLPPGLVPAEALARFASERRVTPYPVLLAAWATALGRACNQPRLLIGAPYAGRDRPGTGDVVGLLASTLVLATDTRADPTFAALVERTAAAVHAGLADADVPFDALVARTVTDRQLGRTPLFQAMFAYEEAGEAAVPGIVLRLPATGAKVPVALWLAASPAGLSGELEHDASLVEGTFATSLLDEFVAILGAGLAEPQARISDLGRASPEAAAGSEEGALDAARRMLPSTVLDLVDPDGLADATALAVDGHEPLSYEALWHRAGVVAERLSGAGVRTEEPVAVLVRSDAASYVSMLGVLRAGGAYVPLDPDTPAQWRAALVAEAGIRHVLDPSAPADQTDPGRAEAHDRRSAPPVPEQAAYVIHTSGSSGRPKGVVVPHRALTGYAVGAARRYDLRATDRVMQLATLAYDGSLEELVATWAAGATVVPAPADVRGTTGPLMAFIAGQRISVLCLTTAHWHALAVALSSGDTTVPACLRLVVFGGEAADPRHAEAWAAHAPGVRLVDSYGPTEATVVATTTEVRGGEDAGLIGQPLARVAVEVLCHDDRPAGPGQLGELCIGGVGVARGYLGDARTTAARFVPDPTAEPGARRYRTGDLVRHEPDGLLRFAGRLDGELKVRGFRVDPSVVEGALLSCPGIAQAAVAADGDRLVAAVEPLPGALPDPRAVRARLAELLPRHLVPSQVVVVGALPVTDRGKVDRHALVGLARTERLRRATSTDQTDGEASSDPTLGTLLQVWSAVLGQPVHAHDDFFADLGGHSLLALRLAHEAARALSREVPVRAVFEASTPVQLAGWLHAHRPVRPLPPLDIVGASRGPLSVAQERIWKMQQAAPATAQFTMAASARLDQALDPQLLAQAWYVLSLRHDVLRWRIRPAASGAPQFVVDPTPATILVHDLRIVPAARTEAAVTDLVGSARRHVFDLSAEPPVLMAQLRLPSADVLLIAAHHLASDEATIALLFAELAAIYRTIAEDVPLTLPPQGPSAGDYAAWERAALASGAFDADREHWSDVLRLPLAPLPVLGESADAQSRTAYRLGATTAATLPGDDRAVLLRLAADARTTPFTVMLALVMRAVAAMTEQSDVRVATMAANRQSSDRAGLVGLLTNTLVIRCAVDPGRPLPDTLAGVRAATMNAFDHQELPFEVVLADLDAEVRPSELAPVLLLWSRADADGRSAVDRVAPHGTSGFALVVDVVERPDRLDVTLVHESDSAEPAARLLALVTADLASPIGGRA